MLYTEIFPTWTEDSYLSLGIPRPMGELDKRKVVGTYVLLFMTQQFFLTVEKS